MIVGNEVAVQATGDTLSIAARFGRALGAAFVACIDADAGCKRDIVRVMMRDADKERVRNQAKQRE